MKTFSCFYLALALGSAGCAGTAPAPQNDGVKAGDAGQVIEGTAAYRERIAMPPNAVFEAVLQDVSRADAPAMEIARTTIPDAPTPPIRFTIPFDAAKIDSRLSYTVRAAIRVDGKLWFASDTAYPVLTRGAGNTVDILLKRVAEPPAEGARLMNTTWRILSLAGGPVSATEGKREPQLMLKSANGRDSWSATVGCNQMSGGVAVNGNGIAFKSGHVDADGLPAATRRARETARSLAHGQHAVADPGQSARASRRRGRSDIPLRSDSSAVASGPHAGFTTGTDHQVRRAG